MGQKIVIVEDDPGISDILRIILHKNGYSVEEHIEENAITDFYRFHADLVLLDKLHTDGDGLDICKTLKQEERMNDVPVIILSAASQLREKAIEAGADAFIEKPFTSAELLLRIRDCINESAFRQLHRNFKHF